MPHPVASLDLEYLVRQDWRPLNASHVVSRSSLQGQRSLNASSTRSGSSTLSLFTPRRLHGDRNPLVHSLRGLPAVLPGVRLIPSAHTLWGRRGLKQQAVPHRGPRPELTCLKCPGQPRGRGHKRGGAAVKWFMTPNVVCHVKLEPKHCQ